MSLPHIESLNLRLIRLELRLVYNSLPNLAPPPLRIAVNWPTLPQITLQYAQQREPTAEEVRAALLPFIVNRAKEVFPSMINDLAKAHGFPLPTCIRLGLQRTRWASRSSSGTVSVNILLMFLPRPLVEHTILHELCHIRYMNHSREFWSLLTQLDPLTPAHNAAMKTAERDYIPAWFR